MSIACLLYYLSTTNYQHGEFVSNYYLSCPFLSLDFGFYVLFWSLGESLIAF